MRRNDGRRRRTGLIVAIAGLGLGLAGCGTSSASDAASGANGGGRAEGRVQLLTVPVPRGRPRQVWVYRPNVPDQADLPVLYFLHGVPGGPADIFQRAHLERILDAYLAAGGRPFVVAAVDGRGARHADTEWVDAVDGTDPIASDLLGPEIDAVEDGHRRDAAHRALAGFSMGGYGAMNLAMQHPAVFGQVVSIGGYFHVDDPSGMLGRSPAVLAANTPADHPAAARGLRVQLVDSTADRDVVARGQTPPFAARLRAAGVPTTLTMLPGIHNWAFVQAALPGIAAFLEAGWPAGPAGGGSVGGGPVGGGS